MLATYNIPRDWTHAISAGSFATDPAALMNRKPSERCMVVWPAGAQTIGTTQQISFTRGQSFAPRLACLLGSNLPVGLKVQLHGKRVADSNFDYALGGNSLTQTIRRLPGGSTGCIWVLEDELDPVIGGAVTLFNDVGGATAIEAEAEQQIGELVLSAGVHIQHEQGPQQTWVDPSPEHRGPGAQIDRGRYVPYRTLALRGVAEEVELAWLNGLPGGLDWDQLLEAWAFDPWALIVPYFQTAEEVQRTAIFGRLKGLGISGITGPLKQLDRMSLDEVPG